MSSDNGRCPPYNLDAEESLLGAMLLSRDAIVAASEVGVSADDFYKPAHAHVFAAITSLAGACEPADPVTVADELRRAGVLDEAGGLGLLVSLQVRTPATSSAPRYARIVSEHALRRRLISVAGEIADSAYSAPDDVTGAVERVRALVADVGAGCSSGDPSGLQIEDVGVVAARVDAALPPQFLARPVITAGAYGIMGAENKAGKTWAGLDLAVAVASGGRWLASYPCEAPGPVLVFLGEGDERKTIRRLRAVCDHHGVALEGLPIRVCHRAPQLGDDAHVARIGEELRNRPTALVVVDPLYLAAGGANSSNLFDMGALFAPVQHACQLHGAALLVVHHWNQTGMGKGRERFSGAGPAEWGRFTISASVETRTTELDGASNVVLSFEMVGDEMPDTTLRLRRRVRAEDPDSLRSPLRYSLTVLDDRPPVPSDGRLAGEKPAVRRCSTLLGVNRSPLTVGEMGSLLATEGTPLKPRTIQDALKRLAELGLAVSEPVQPGEPTLRWSSAEIPKSASDLHACTSVHTTPPAALEALRMEYPAGEGEKCL